MGGVKNHEKYAKYAGQGLSRGSFPQDASDGTRLYRLDSLMMVGMLLPADGVANRYPIALHLIFRVNVSVECVAGIGVPQRCCRVRPPQTRPLAAPAPPPA